MSTNPFGRWIKKLRAEQDLTQEQLSELVGCATPTLRSFEIGIRRPSRAMAERIADVLRVLDPERSEFLRLARQAVEPTPAEPSEPEPMIESTAQASSVAPPRTLIGREAEINTLSHLLREERQRLVTIVGPGGMGKTSLAQKVAAECGRHFRHGAAFVTLAAVADGQNVPSTIADGLGLSLQQTMDVRERLLQLLSEREQLVVLDNFEHLLTPTAPGQASAIEFIQNILQRSTGIQLLITSRERLRIQRERTFELTGLLTPRQQARDYAAAEADATMLFVERAQQVAGHFALTHDNRDAVVRICNLLDGMPLALELAASWVRVLSCAEIADEIQRSIDFLALADRDMAPRHRSMRAVFDQSWALLTGAERQAMARLSIFRGGCRREAAAAVANANLPLLASLIDKSLLRKQQVGTVTRYDMHELIRQYTEDQLRTDPVQYTATQTRHAEYYLNFVQERNEAINTEQSREVMAQLNTEIDNLRQSWEWAVTNRRGDLLHATGFTMWIFLEVRNFYREGEELFRRAAEMAQQLRRESGADRQAADILWAHMTTHQAYFTHRQVRPLESRRLLEPVIALLRQLDAPMVLQQALFAHGGASWFHGDFADAVADYRDGLVIANQLRTSYLLSFHNVFSGATLYEVGEYEASYQHLLLGVEYARHFQDPRSLSFALSYLNRTGLTLGRNAETTPLVEEALQIAWAADDLFCVSLALEQQALLHQAQGELNAAQQRFTEALSLSVQIGDVWSRSRQLNLMGQLALQRGKLGEAQQCFRNAFQLARPVELLAHAVDAVAGLAAFFGANGDFPQAFLLAMLVEQHAASNHATRQRATQLLAEFTARLTASEQSALQARQQNTAFDVLVTEALKV